jgi:hypothetical protein
VISTNERGDSVLRAIAVEGSGVYTIHGTAGETAMIEYGAQIDEQPVSLALERITLKQEGRTSCALNVESPPRTIRIVDREGEPIPSVHLVLRERDNATSWSFGSPAGDTGEVRTAIPMDIPLSIRASKGEHELLAIDEALPTVGGAGDITVLLESSKLTTIRVLLDGEPAAGQEIELFGAHSSNTFRIIKTGAEGESEPLGITDESNARSRLVRQDVWTRRPFEELAQGLNIINCYSVGTLELGASTRLQDVTFLDGGGSLEDWRREGRLQKLDAEAMRYEVPVGTYRLTDADGAISDLSVRPGEITRVNL